ncbi:MAG: class I SAM-dependent methyltransferase [Candidatus Delongbacteria bacterium]|nr:class I SAM-dependent methyltransferase [Candidatus Delongbacteria bacterium]
MNLKKSFENFVKFILNDCTPPILRDQKFFIWGPFNLLFKDKKNIFFEFKDKIKTMPKNEIEKIYSEISDVQIQCSETDLNKKCLDKIIKNIKGTRIIDVGCGKAQLINIFKEKYDCCGCDIYISDETIKLYPGINFKQADIVNLPYVDGEFDTVICTHTLEHIIDFREAVNELRRIAKKRLIIVVPKERPYKYTFNLHIWFFPYVHSFINMLHEDDKVSESDCCVLGDSIYYQEDFKE